MKNECFLAHCDNDFCQRKPISHLAAQLLAILSFEFSSIQVVGSVGGRRSQDPRIINRIIRHITTMHLVLLTLSFLYTMLDFIDSTFIDISFSHSFKLFILITCHLFRSWQEGPALCLLLLFLQYVEKQIIYIWQGSCWQSQHDTWQWK